MGEGNNLFKINSFKQNNNINKPAVKKSKTFIEESIHRLNVQNIFNNIGQNRLGTVLETINEVSNSKIDSSEISDKSDEDNKNIENNNNNNKNIKEANNSDNKKNESEYNTTPKNTIHLNV